MSQPPYHFLLKMDTWSKKDAALIISGIDPLPYRSIRFTQKEIPAELASAYQLYRIFESVHFAQKYGRYQPHPLDYISECQEKDIPLPDQLIEALTERLEYIKRYQPMMVTQASSQNEITQDDPQGLRERKCLLKIIGALTTLYYANKNRLSDLTCPNVTVSNVVEDILQYLENHDLHSPGLGKSNLHKKIKEGLDLFFEEYID